MTQVNTIRTELLKGNTLTQRSALMDFGIMALPRRIADLKEQGFPIKSEMKTNPLTGQRYAQYSLSKGVTSLSQLQEGAVYRLVNVKRHPFMNGLVEVSRGYFKFEGLFGGYADILMAGKKQIFGPSWLEEGDFEIEYVGGIQ